MRLDTLKPAEGSRKAAVRVGRGIGSGLGKTCGRGVKVLVLVRVLTSVQVSKAVRCQ